MELILLENIFQKITYQKYLIEINYTENENINLKDCNYKNMQYKYRYAYFYLIKIVK